MATDVPTPYESTPAVANAAIENSSRSFVTVIFVLVAPSESSKALTRFASTPRSPESSRTAPRFGASAIAFRTAFSISNVSTKRVVCSPKVSNCALNACSSVSCSKTKECAAVPMVLMPQLRPASRFEVASKPAMYAARATATAACSLTRRPPISAKNLPLAAVTILEAAAATDESELKIERISVSSKTASAKLDSTVSTGELAKKISPSR